MERIDDCCHQFKRLHQQRHKHMSTLQQQSTDPHISKAAFQSLDTVRSLHQTVVYLRTALEKAHREIDSLKKQITVKDDIQAGKKYLEQEFVAKSKHLDNSLSNNDFDRISGANKDSKDCIKLQAQIAQNAKIDLKNDEKKSFDEHSATHQSTESLNSNQSQQESSASSRKATTTKRTHSNEHQFQHSFESHQTQHNHQLIRNPMQTSFEGKQVNNQMTDTSKTLSNRRLPQMASKIDVKIKLTSNFQIDGDDTNSASTSGSVSGILC